MKSLGKKISEARKKRGLSQQQLGQLAGLAQNAVSLLESDSYKGSPAPQTLIRISDALTSPEILIHHCESCPVRRHVTLKLFPDLNNIRRDPAIVATRLRREMVEAAEALDRMSERFSDADYRNQSDFLPKFEADMEQVIDVKRGIEILEFELLLSHAVSTKDMADVYESQQRKCEQHGHHLKSSEDSL